MYPTIPLSQYNNIMTNHSQCTHPHAGMNVSQTTHSAHSLVLGHHLYSTYHVSWCWHTNYMQYMYLALCWYECTTHHLTVHASWMYDTPLSTCILVLANHLQYNVSWNVRTMHASWYWNTTHSAHILVLEHHSQCTHSGVGTPLTVHAYHPGAGMNARWTTHSAHASWC